MLNSIKHDRNQEFTSYLEKIRSEDVTPDCFEKCLKIALKKDNSTAVGLLLMRKPRNVKECLIKALKKSNCSKSTLLLLLCYAVEKQFNSVIKVICETKDFELGGTQWICDIQISIEQMRQLT